MPVKIGLTITQPIASPTQTLLNVKSHQDRDTQAMKATHQGIVQLTQALLTQRSAHQVVLKDAFQVKTLTARMAGDQHLTAD
jgi:hypothetical protein